MISGLRSGQQQDRWGISNIGGSLQVADGTFRLPPGTVAEVVLTPIGPGLDGSPLSVIRRAEPMVFMITDIGRQMDFELRDDTNASLGPCPLVFPPNDAGVAGVKRVRLMIR